MEDLLLTAALDFFSVVLLGEDFTFLFRDVAVSVTVAKITQITQVSCSIHILWAFIWNLNPKYTNLIALSEPFSLSDCLDKGILINDLQTMALHRFVFHGNIS